MTELKSIDNPPHQRAQAWAEELLERIHWMEPKVKKSFLSEAFSIATEELSTVGLALAIGDLYRAEDIFTELKEIHGEGEA